VIRAAIDEHIAGGAAIRDSKEGLRNGLSVRGARRLHFVNVFSPVALIDLG
jgi:hypothetical protein